MPRWVPGRRAWTFWGWTPGIQRLVAGKGLACGCLIGEYDIRTGQRVVIVDAKALNCHNSGHVPNLVLHVDAGCEGTVGSQISAIDEADRQVPFSTLPSLPGRTMLRRLLIVVTCLALSTSCDQDTPTSPTATDTATTVAEPTMNEVFAGTLPVGGAKFSSFSTTTYGRVDVTLTAVGGAFVPSTVMLGLGLGQPSGEECVTTTSVNVVAGSAPQVTGPYAAGVYCVRLADLGNLFAPATFSISIAYP